MCACTHAGVLHASHNCIPKERGVERQSEGDGGKAWNDKMGGGEGRKGGEKGRGEQRAGEQGGGENSGSAGGARES